MDIAKQWPRPIDNFQRPIRYTIMHTLCNTRIPIEEGQANLMARCPGWYTALPCPHCKGVFEIKTFLWFPNGEPIA